MLVNLKEHEGKVDGLPILYIHPNIQLLVLLFFPNFIDLSAYSSKSNCSSVQYERKGPGNKYGYCSTGENAMEDAQERQREELHWRPGL